jgi:hypothetical protein
LLDDITRRSDDAPWGIGRQDYDGEQSARDNLIDFID